MFGLRREGRRDALHHLHHATRRRDTLITRNATYPYLLELRRPYSEEGTHLLRSLQGARWIGEDKCWRVPEEYGDKLAKWFGETVPLVTAPFDESSIRARRGYQTTATERGVKANGGIVLAFEMKLGKSPVALDIARMRGHKRILIVAPAMSIPTWLRMVEKWWPELKDRTYWLEKDPNRLGKKEKIWYGGHCNLPESITICSYNLLKQLVTSKNGALEIWDCIMFDEFQALANYKSVQSTWATTLVRNNIKSFRIGMTGTPQANDTASLYGPLNIIFPERYGIFYWDEHPERSFGGRYTNVSWNGHGRDFEGIKEETREELQQRLGWIMARAVKSDPEVAKTLPPLTPESVRKGADFSIKKVVEEAIEGGATGIAVMCALNKTWTDVYTQLSSIQLSSRIAKSDAGSDFRTGLITGEEIAKERDARLESLKTASIAVGVFSIAACAMTLDLSRFNTVFFMELTEKPAQMSQVVARFQVPGGLNPISVTFYYDSANYETAMRLERKMEAMSAVMAAGNSELQMREAFGKQNRFTQEEWHNAIADALSFTM